MPKKTKAAPENTKAKSSPQIHDVAPSEKELPSPLRRLRYPLLL